MFVLIFLINIALCNCETRGYTDELARKYMFPLSAAAYSDSPTECVKKLGNESTVYNQTYAKCTGNCSGFTAVLHERKAIVLSFSGTTDMQQLFAEIKESTFKEWSNWTHGGRVSKYFYDAFLSLWNGGMEKDFENLAAYYQNYEIWVTGHSLGGALATLAASVVAEKHKRTNVKLVTFGQPRVGDKTFADRHNKVVFYAEMDSTDKHTVCNRGENSGCSGFVLYRTVRHHVNYFGKYVSFYGIDGCDDTVLYSQIEVVYDDCVLEDSLSQGDWHIEEDPNVDYEMLLRGYEPVLNVPRSRARQTWIKFRRPPRNCWKEEGL